MNLHVHSMIYWSDLRFTERTVIIREVPRRDQAFTTSENSRHVGQVHNVKADKTPYSSR